jgi:hypothetical protein
LRAEGHGPEAGAGHGEFGAREGSLLHRVYVKSLLSGIRVPRFTQSLEDVALKPCLKIFRFEFFPAELAPKPQSRMQGGIADNEG